MIMMVVLGSVAFGRDFDHRERNDIGHVMNYSKVSQERLSREVNLSNENIQKYSEFHWDLITMDRGQNDRD